MSKQPSTKAIEALLDAFMGTNSLGMYKCPGCNFYHHPGLTVVSVYENGRNDTKIIRCRWCQLRKAARRELKAIKAATR